MDPFKVGSDQDVLHVMVPPSLPGDGAAELHNGAVLPLVDRHLVQPVSGLPISDIFSSEKLSYLVHHLDASGL